MSSRILAIDGPLAASPYPERSDVRIAGANEWTLRTLDRLRRLVPSPPGRRLRAIEAARSDRAASCRSASDADLRRQLNACAVGAVHRLAAAELRTALVVVAEMARRAVAIDVHPNQLLGAETLLRGRLAEMATGEGKTLTAALAACIAAAAGVPVHVVTVNDYLASRDADTMAPLFALAGLDVGTVVHDRAPEARRAAYGCAVAYCTNKELVFDYLRDRVAAGGRCNAAQSCARRLFDNRLGRFAAAPLMRGLHFAIVDEADSILIDEARTPLVLAAAADPGGEPADCDQALALAARLQRGLHYDIDSSQRAVGLTVAGRAALTAMCAGLQAAWRVGHVREHLVTQALTVIHLFARDQQYVIDEAGTLQIVDEYTGRILTGRRWDQGLHQMIEAKEGLVLSQPTETLARITYQRFFTRYLRLAGLTGTAREAAGEMAAVYGLRTVSIPTHRPCRATRLPDRVFVDQSAKWQAVAAFVAERRRAGQPVLLGTRSVAASERLSAVLRQRGVRHEDLNARHSAREAEVIARAGSAGAVTVATNMAGRGTDIPLGPGVADQGGLCVVLTEYHDSRRIDRQLFGRCARQGDPGLRVAFVAIDDAMPLQHARLLARQLARWRAMPHRLLWLAVALVRRCAQAAAQRLHARQRRDALRRDWELERQLAFCGDPI